MQLLGASGNCEVAGEDGLLASARYPSLPLSSSLLSPSIFFIYFLDGLGILKKIGFR